jgi:hypothetical protein
LQSRKTYFDAKQEKVFRLPLRGKPPQFKKYCCPLKLKRTTYYKRLLSANPQKLYKTLTKSATLATRPGLRIFFGWTVPYQPDKPKTANKWS